MKYIQSEQFLDVPEGVHFEIKARVVSVTGPRGTLKRDLKHIDVAFHKLSSKQIKIQVLHGSRKHVAAVRTVKSILQNMITGVTKGFKYKMRYVYAHFPINVNIEDKGSKIEIRNYLGEKQVRTVNALEGVTVEVDKSAKDTLQVLGNSLENVSQTAADIQQICKARNKDIRKFLDGIYVSERLTIED